MAKRNLTLKIDETLLKRSRHLAVEEDKSLSEWVADLIAKAVIDTKSFEVLRDQAIAKLSRPMKLGGKVLTRDQVHER